MSEIDTLIRLIEINKKDIITVVNARYGAIEHWIKEIDDRTKKDIGDLEGSLGDLHKEHIARGQNCPLIEDLRPMEKTVKFLNFFCTHKFITISATIGVLVVIQSIVFLLFTKLELLEIFKLIYP